MFKITLKDNMLKEIGELDRTTGEYYDTISLYNFKDILKNTDENLFEKLIHNNDSFRNLAINKLKHIDKDFLFKPLFTIANNIFDDESDGDLLDDVMFRLDGIPISKYFYDRHWSLNLYVDNCINDCINDCIKLLANRLTEEMFQTLGEDFFKEFEKRGYTISIDKNYCNSNFHKSEVYYKYSDTGCNRNFSRLQFESLVVRVDRINLVKQRFKDDSYVMDFHKNRYKLNKTT